ncbi:hypothetical protein GCM10023215_19540 [Pseudonocardia yuanmonensis]|uniref:Uncharacterized protein n=1 Tax=Pseudonocardia yuanmonensis TaxID=1095914 RepID=A0ABP8WAJ2_9PSEU
MPAQRVAAGGRPVRQDGVAATGPQVRLHALGGAVEQDQPDPGQPPAQRGGQLGQRIDGERRHRGDHELAGPQRHDLLDRAAGPLDVGHYPPRRLDQRPARGRGDEAAAGPLEQGDAELLLEPPDRFRQRRLREVQRLGRPGDPAVLHNGQEVLGRPRFHDPTVTGPVAGHRKV